MKKTLQSWLMITLFLITGGFAQTATAPSAGDGSSGNPYQIGSLENLYWIAASDAVVASPSQATRWAAYYVQTGDIDASETSTWSGGTGWTPIGNLSTYFTGSYDGGSHSIDGLYINRSGSNEQALFGVTNNASIQNLGMTNVDITGNSTVAPFAGYLYVNSTLTNCYSTGTVVASSYSAGLCANVHTSSTITNSFSSCTVTATSQSAGGLVGRLDDSSIENSCFLGSVSGYEYAGGVSGFLYQSTVSNCYSAGAVSGSSSIGGLIGASNSSTVTNSFWDTEASGRSTSSGGTGKTTAEMKLQSTFTDAGWDFEGETTNGTNDYWDLNEPVVYNNGYPFLAWQEGTDVGMPVELSSFTAIARGRGVELAWKTTTEVNNHGFEIQRSEVRGQKSEKNWTSVGFIEGAGNSNAPKEYSYTDKVPVSGKYLYRLKQVDNDGKFEYSSSVEVNASTLASGYELAQNHPNPFNPTTTIAFALAKDEFVSLKVYDMLGKEIATLVNGKQSAGAYTVSFKAITLPSGIYFYTLRAGNNIETKKMLLVK